MKKYIKFSVCFSKLFLLLANLIFIQVSLSSNLKSEESDSGLKDLASKVQKVTLKNGLRVLIYKRGVAPVFAGVVTVKVGGVDETLGHTGISHMLEHMAFKGTKDFGTKDYSKEKPLLDQLEELVSANQGLVPSKGKDAEKWKEIQKQLATLWDSEAVSRAIQKAGGVGLNATTSQELTNYFVELPTSAFEFWCWLESQRLFRPVMRQFYKERDVVMEERRMRFDDDPEGKLYEILLQSAFLSHPYRNPTIGYPFDISRVTARQTLEFHNQYYVPANMVVSVVGDIDLEKDLPIIEKYFGQIESRPIPPAITAVEEKQMGERVVKLNDKASPQFVVAYKKPVYPSPEDAKITVMSEILAGSVISPLYDHLVKKTSKAVSVSHYEAPGYAYPNILMFSLVPKSPVTNSDLLVAFDREIERFIRKGVTSDQLEIAKRSISVSLLNRFKSSLSLAKELASSELLYGEWDALLKWYEQVQVLTGKDIRQAAKRYLIADNRTVAFLN